MLWYNDGWNFSPNGGFYILMYWLVALIVLALDQWTKYIVVTHMELGESIPVWGSFFSITSHRNAGAAWGILQGQRWFFIAVTIFVVIGVIVYMIKMIREGRRFLPFALSLLLGGAVGNFIDRLRMGEVVDFLHVFFDFRGIGIPFTYDFPIFNVADMGIVIGISLVILDTILDMRREKRSMMNDSVDG